MFRVFGCIFKSIIGHNIINIRNWVVSVNNANVSRGAIPSDHYIYCIKSLYIIYRFNYFYMFGMLLYRI